MFQGDSSDREITLTNPNARTTAENLAIDVSCEGESVELQELGADVPDSTSSLLLSEG